MVIVEWGTMFQNVLISASDKEVDQRISLVHHIRLPRLQSSQPLTNNDDLTFWGNGQVWSISWAKRALSISQLILPFHLHSSISFIILDHHLLELYLKHLHSKYYFRSLTFFFQKLYYNSVFKNFKSFIQYASFFEY